MLNGKLPGTSDVTSFLKDFGTICDLRWFCIKGGQSVGGLPNTAIVVFDSMGAVERIFKSFATSHGIDGSFWQAYSVVAIPFRNPGPFDDIFSKRVFPRLVSKLQDNRNADHDSNQPPQPGGSRPVPGSEDHRPRVKRLRTESREGTSDVATVMGNHASTSRQTSSSIPESPEWMRARIVQLAADLQSARATLDISRLEQDLMRRDHQTELERVRLEITSQKNAAEEALSRKTAEYDTVFSGFKDVLARELALTSDMNHLREKLATSDENLRLTQSSLDEFANFGGKVKALELELEGARSRAYKLQVQNAQLEQNMNMATTELHKANSKAKQLESKVKQLEVDLVSSREKLGSTEQSLASTQRSLESMEEKCSSTYRQYESTKEKLGTCKETLENERMIMRNLKDTLTLDVYRSLGATHQSLGAFLSAIGQPPISEEGNVLPKKESD
ncbi:unnamed protein product [Rhizoctonia solani]|uniref:Uncharacterized protein n=1 Tax=Rhizoctonia solani TaxID=456999 RepID=A0A8H3BKC5_9AGAM|nr:unnamed protein product [Rhizoctonia solani]